MRRTLEKLDRRITAWMITGIFIALCGTILGYINHQYTYISWGICAVMFYIAKGYIRIKEDIEYEIKHFGN